MVVIERHRGVNIVRTSKGFAFIWDGFVKTCDSIAGARLGIDSKKGIAMTDQLVIDRIVAAQDPDILEGCDMDQIRREIFEAYNAGGFEGLADLLGWEVSEVERVVFAAAVEGAR